MFLLITYLNERLGILLPNLEISLFYFLKYLLSYLGNFFWEHLILKHESIALPFIEL